MTVRLTMPRRALMCLVVALALPLVLVGTAFGQSREAASILGQVTDEGGGVMPGVTVTATSPALQVPEVSATTDERGEYRIFPLPIGTFTLTFELQGFQTIRQEGVRLTGGFTAKIDVVLKVGQLQESVTVSGATPVVDVAATTIATHLTKEVLDTIPTGRNAYIGLMELAPGARANIDVGGSAINATPSFRNFGMQEEAWPAVDGVVTKTPNISDSGNFPDFNTADEATITTMGHDAAVPNRGVAINIIVKSGGNDFHGNAYAGGTNGSLESANTGGAELNYRYDVGADIGGRIVRDKIWFYGGWREQQQDRDVIACNQPDGEPCASFNEARIYTPKVTYQVNPSNRLMSMFFITDRHDIAIAAPTEWSGRRNWGGEPGAAKGEWQGLKGNNMVFSVLGGLWWTRSWTKCVEETCDMIARRDRSTGRIWGNTTREGERNFEARKQIRANMSWYRPDWMGGNHEIKGGADIHATKANRQLLNRGASKNYRLNYLSTTGSLVADRIEIFNAPLLNPSTGGNYYGLYLSDTWTIGRKLTLNLGLRYAYDTVYENEGCREGAPPPGDVAFPDLCWDETRMPLFQMVVPRLRASYDINGDGNTVVKGGWGRYARMRLFDHVQPMANNVISTAVYRWRDLNGNDDYDAGEVNLATNSSDFLSLTLTGTFTSAGRGVVNPNEEQAYTDEFSAQFERQLIPNLAVRVLGLHARINNEIRLGNLLRPYPVYNIPIASPDPGPDGTTGNADDTGEIITWYDYPAALSGLAFQKAIYVNDSAANSDYSTIEVALSKRLSNNWQFQGSYSATKRDIPLVPNEDTFNTRDPNSEIFASDNNWEWLGRLSGSYLFPHGILFAARYEHRSGDPWARTALLRGGTQIPNITVNVEPIGSQRLPNINLMTLRVEKQFAVGAGKVLSTRANLANLFNTDAATAITTLSGANYGLVSARVLPRVVNFEVQYRF